MRRRRSFDAVSDFRGSPASTRITDDVKPCFKRIAESWLAPSSFVRAERPWGSGFIRVTAAGWDSDNPTATWGGLLGFMSGKEGVEKAFSKEFSNRFDIHRTRVGFENDGIDTFDNMARKGIWVECKV
jgi:hypothetical protein